MKTGKKVRVRPARNLIEILERMKKIMSWNIHLLTVNMINKHWVWLGYDGFDQHLYEVIDAFRLGYYPSSVPNRLSNQILSNYWILLDMISWPYTQYLVTTRRVKCLWPCNNYIKIHNVKWDFRFGIGRDALADVLIISSGKLLVMDSNLSLGTLLWLIRDASRYWL